MIALPTIFNATQFIDLQNNEKFLPSSFSKKQNNDLMLQRKSFDCNVRVECKFPSSSSLHKNSNKNNSNTKNTISNNRRACSIPIVPAGLPFRHARHLLPLGCLRSSVVLPIISPVEKQINDKLRKVALMQYKQQAASFSKFESDQANFEMRMKMRQEKAHTMLVSMWLEVILLTHSFSKFCSLRREYSAQLVFRYLILPRWKVWRLHLQRKTAYKLFLAKKLPRIDKPLPHEFRAQGTLFNDWPDNILKRLIRSLTLTMFWKGEFICYFGQMGQNMFFLELGAVDVLIHKTRKAKPFKVATIQGRMKYFGEFAILAEEPRAASLRCNCVTFCWVLEKNTLDYWISKLPDKQRTAVRANAVDRRKNNLPKLFPVTSKMLRTAPIFEDWPEDALQQLPPLMTPAVFLSHDTLISEGNPADNMYLLVRGEVCVKKRGVEICRLQPPSLVGHIDIIFAERRSATISPLVPTEAWCLSKTDFLNQMAQRPDLFLHVKFSGNAQRAKWLPFLPFELFAELLPLPQKIVPDVSLRILHSYLVARIFDATAALTDVFLPMTEIFFLMNGQVDYGNTRSNNNNNNAHATLGGGPTTTAIIENENLSERSYNNNNNNDNNNNNNNNDNNNNNYINTNNGSSNDSVGVGGFAIGGTEILRGDSKWNLKIKAVTRCEVWSLPIAKFWSWIDTDVTAFAPAIRAHCVKLGRPSKMALGPALPIIASLKPNSRGVFGRQRGESTRSVKPLI